MDKDESKKTKERDELVIMRAITRLLDALSDAARARVVEYLMKRYAAVQA